MSDVTLAKLSDIIEYEHLDGTYCRFTNAYYRELEDGWFTIFTEHNGEHMNNKEDVKWIRKITQETIFYNKEENL